MQDLKQVLGQMFNNPEMDKEQLISVLNYLSQHLIKITKEEENQISNEEKGDTSVKPLGLEFLRDLMEAMIETRWKDAEQMRDKLETFLEESSTKGKKFFALDLYILMQNWARELRTAETLKEVLKDLLSDEFAYYYEWLESLQKQVDSLSESVNRFFDKLRYND
jgi:hypothetical protein